MKSTQIQDRVKTLNNMGNMVLRPNPATDAFLDHVEKTQGYFADIGAAFGHFTFEALNRGGRVMAIDIDQRHLNLLVEHCSSTHLSSLDVKCGHFPNEIQLPPHVFDGILLSRLLIFLNPSEISSALFQVYQALKKGGRVYITSASPLRKKWEPLKAIYEQQKRENAPWPGRIENLWELVPEEKEKLPNAIQLIDAPSLRQGLIEAGFTVEECDYYPQEAIAPEQDFDLTYAIASKSF